MEICLYKDCEMQSLSPHFQCKFFCLFLLLSQIRETSQVETQSLGLGFSFCFISGCWGFFWWGVLCCLVLLLWGFCFLFSFGLFFKWQLRLRLDQIIWIRPQRIAKHVSTARISKGPYLAWTLPLAYSARVYTLVGLNRSLNYSLRFVYSTQVFNTFTYK